MKIYLYKHDSVSDMIWRVRVRTFRTKLAAGVYMAVVSRFYDKAEVINNL